MTVVEIESRGRVHAVELTLVEPGEPRRVGRDRRTVTVGRVWEVRDDGRLIGYVKYDMITRERRTPGRTYVNARWESPGWLRSESRFGGLEKRSRREAVESLVWAMERQEQEQGNV